MTMNLPVRPDATSQQPAVQSFQLDASSVGNVARSVNLFRGDVNIPLTLIELPGRDGLAIKMTAFYGSNVAQDVTTWNAAAPTGVLGLGWSLSPDRIFVDGKTTGDPLDGAYYLQTGGGVDRLLWVGEDAGGVVFQSRANPLWLIRYDRSRERWTVVHEDGTRHLYGGELGDHGALMFGVRWNNWIGASRTASPAPARYVVAWNLARIETAWGSGIDYLYENDNLEVAAGVAYTRASRVREVRDMLRRRVQLHYEDKEAFEYVPPHTAPDGRPEPAYQDRYDTRFLRSIDVLEIGSTAVETAIALDYDFIDARPQPGDPFKKRVLRSVTQLRGGRPAMPPMVFEYQSAANPGALSAITFPEGGRAEYTYSVVELNQGTSDDVFHKNITVKNPLPQGRPVVLQGPGYVAIAWYSELRATTQIDIYSFTGRWSAPWSVTVPGRVKLDESRAVLGDAFFALYLAPADSVSSVKLRLFERVPYQLGTWTVRELPVTSQRPIVGAETTLVSGDGFVVLHLGGDTTIHRWTYDPVRESWREDVHMHAGATRIALGAASDYYIAGYYSDAARALAYQIFSREPSGAWRAGAVGPHGETFAWEPAYATGLWALGAAFAVATYFRDGASEPRLRMLVWNTSFDIAQDLVRDGGSFGTEVHGSTVGSGRFLYRYDGARWQPLELHGGSGTLRYAHGDDVAIVSRIEGSGHHSTLATYNAATSQWKITTILGALGEAVDAAAPAAPAEVAIDQVYAPTISGDVLTVGSEVRRRAPDGSWNVIATLPANGAKASLQNRAPEYLAIQDQPSDPTKTTTTMLILDNGQVAVRHPFARQQLASAGTASAPSVAGPRVLVSYPAGQSTESPTELYLHRLLNHAVSDEQFDIVAAAARIASGYDATVTSYSYDTALAVFDASGEVVQYPSVVEALCNAAGAPVGGTTEHTFYNGLPGALTAAAPRSVLRSVLRSMLRSMVLQPTNADEYYSLLAGMVRMIQVRDADGLEVSTTVHEWKGQRLETGPGTPLGVLVPAVQPKLMRTTQIDGGLYLFGLPPALAAEFDRGVLSDAARAAFAARGLALGPAAMVTAVEPGAWWEIADAPRSFPVRRAAADLSVFGSVVRSADQAYDPHSGFLVARRSSLWSAEGRDEMIEDATGYAWRVPAYGGMIAARLLTAVSDQRQVNLSRGTTVTAVATTYRNDWGAGAAWAQDAFWSWRGGTQLAPPFPYGDGDRAAWVRTEATLARNAQGQPLVGETASGPVQSMCYDASGYHGIATFQNVDLAAHPAAAEYCGFESYEGLARWQLAGGGPIDPLVTDRDAHTGARSLALPGGPAAPSAVTRLALPAGAGTQVVSAWVKTPPGFPAGVAGVRITLGAAGEVVPIVDSHGRWQQIWRFVEPGRASTGPVAVTLQIFNDGPDAVLVDDVRIGPVVGEFAAEVFDDRTFRRTASLADDGATLRYLEDRTGQPIATIGPDEQVTGLVGRHYSRSWAGAFDPARPNAEWTIAAAAGGFHDDFRGGDWQVRWHADQPSHWAALDGALVHRTATPDTVSLRGSSELRSFALRFELRAPTLPTAALGVAFGDTCRVRWSPEERQWQIVARSGAVVAWHAAAVPDGALVAVALPRAVLVYLDGAQILAHAFDDDVAGMLALFAADPGVGFASIFVVHRPRLAASYLDGVGRPRQDQSQGDDAAVVTATVCDPLGRPAITTKAMAYDRGLVGYRSQFVTGIDWGTGVMTGELAAYYTGGERSDDEGYPYQRRRESASPMPLVVELGAPGATLAIRPGNPHTARFQRCAKVKDGFLDELPACEYYLDRAIDADGNITEAIRDKGGRTVGQRRIPGDGGPDTRASYRYDERGALSAGRPPNFYRPPNQVDPAAFVVTQKNDVFDHMIESHDGSTGTTDHVYSDAGLLRFTLKSSGRGSGAGGTDRIIYQCYDAIGRPIETGVVEATWDRAELNRRASTSWPLGTGDWRYRYDYDGDGRAIHGLGRMVRLTVRRGADQPPLTQELDYDASGNVVRLRAHAGGDPGAYEVGYAYNVAGDVLSIAYPESAGAGDVAYHYDALGRMVSVGSPAQNDAFARYAYTANGAFDRVTLNPRGPSPIARRYRYNSPDWPTRIEAGPFTEQLAYWEQPGHGDARYYTGALARISNEFGGAAGAERPYAWLNAYDGAGRLRTAQNTLDEHYSVGAGAHPVRYDADGNVLDYGDGTALRTFRYQAGTDRIEAVDGAGPYHYDRDGNTVVIAGPDGARLTYNEASGLVTRIEPAAGGATALEYGVGDQRCAKRWTDAEGRAHERHYLFGALGRPLVERTREAGGAARAARYIYGPDGAVIAVVTDDGPGFVVADHLGSTRLVLGADGALWGGYNYRPLGDFMGAPTGMRPDAMRYLFTGQELDRELGLYNYNARLYDPRLGRFVSPDPARQYWSPYLYGGGDPLNMVDPSGELAFLAALAIAALVGAIVGAGAGAAGYGISYALNDDPNKKWDWREFGISVGVGAAAGLVGGAVGFGAGAAVSAGAVALGYSASSIAVGVVAGGVGGVAGGVTGQVVGNAIAQRPLTEGLLQAAIVGGVLGAVTGGIGARLSGGAARGGAAGNTVQTSAGVRGAVQSPGRNGYVRYRDLMELVPAGTPDGWAPTPNLRRGFSYQFGDTQGVQWTIRGHQSHVTAPAGSNSRLGWTARIERLGGGQLGHGRPSLLSQDARIVSPFSNNNYNTFVNRVNDTHIPLRFF